MANKVKSMLRADQPTIGGWVTIGHPSVAEIVASTGFDWVVVDMESGALSCFEVQMLFQAMAPFDVVPMVRVPKNDPKIIGQVLDMGALGVVVPLVNSRAEAEAAVSAAKYPPEGTRGVSVSRAHGYGTRFKEYIDTANEDVLVVIQIEHIDAVNNIDDILSVKGIDAVFIGPADLSGSMGLLGQPRHPEVQEMFNRILEGARRHNIPTGLHTLSGAEAKEKSDAGFRFIALSSDSELLGVACNDELQIARAK
ncbi:MAG TPA: aldolase/citrate lyase family protein [Bacillota bacterium]|nr:aldolase/citrate lyase family protein [Bacillota bacterium]